MGEDFCSNCGKTITCLDIDDYGGICLRCGSRKIYHIA